MCAASGGSLLTPAHAPAEGELASISGDGFRPGTGSASLGVAEVDDAADASALMLLLPLTLGIDKVGMQLVVPKDAALHASAPGNGHQTSPVSLVLRELRGRRSIHDTFRSYKPF